MNQKKFQKLSVVALIISLLPLVTFIPVLIRITLTCGDGGRTIADTLRSFFV